MTAVKNTSSIQENKRAFGQCPVTLFMEKVRGFWKPIILYHLFSGGKRYGELKRAIPEISEKVLIQQLKQMEADKLIIREAKPEIPPHVTYRLSPAGQELFPVIDAMIVWADKVSTAGVYNG